MRREVVWLNVAVRYNGLQRISPAQFGSIISNMSVIFYIILAEMLSDH